MNDGFHYDAAGEADLPAVARILSDAFAGPLAGSTDWARMHAPGSLRVLRDAPGAPPAACLVRIPMGQWFGRRRVPMVGIAGVGVRHERRGAGLARRMMAACIRDLAAEGVALSTLYASTRPLYRSVGYEAAGSRYRYAVPIEKFAGDRAAATLRELTRDDDAAIAACYDACAADQNGVLDRGAYCWQRVWKFREDEFRGFGAWSPAGQLDGYVMIHQKRNPEFGKHDVLLSDIAASSPAAWAALRAFIAGFGTMGDRVIWYGGATHPLYTALAHPWGTVELHEPWMTRVVSVPAALNARGYDPGVRARACFEVADDLVESNRGTWTLEVEGGRGAASRGGSPGAKVSIRGLAAIFTGYLTPCDAVLAGLCEGDAATLTALRSIFAGPSPWMGDFF
ncbi:MAG: hypothetical protein HBSAPP03_27260 [Phycisphaerae bacterium]|nr:MAG: hypothetical protein HBSAPP03_27260 [Phycisphaerae bacterium]